MIIIVKYGNNAVTVTMLLQVQVPVQYCTSTVLVLVDTLYYTSTCVKNVLYVPLITVPAPGTLVFCI